MVPFLKSEFDFSRKLRPSICFLDNEICVLLLFLLPSLFCVAGRVIFVHFCGGECFSVQKFVRFDCRRSWWWNSGQCCCSRRKPNVVETLCPIFSKCLFFIFQLFCYLIKWVLFSRCWNFELYLFCTFGSCFFTFFFGVFYRFCCLSKFVHPNFQFVVDIDFLILFCWTFLLFLSICYCI